MFVAAKFAAQQRRTLLANANARHSLPFIENY